MAPCYTKDVWCYPSNLPCCLTSYKHIMTLPWGAFKVPPHIPTPCPRPLLAQNKALHQGLNHTMSHLLCQQDIFNGTHWTLTTFAHSRESMGWSINRLHWRATYLPRLQLYYGGHGQILQVCPFHSILTHVYCSHSCISLHLQRCLTPWFSFHHSIW